MPPTVSNSEQFKLPNPPSDAVSVVRFQPGKGSQLLLAASWDCTVRLYDVASGSQRAHFPHACPVLAGCFTDALHAVSGSLEGAVKYFDVNTEQVTKLGKCGRAVSAAVYSAAMGAPVTGSWDKTVRVWDTRSPGGEASKPMMCEQPDTVYTLDVVSTTLVVGTAGRHLMLWDLRNLSQPLDHQESPLRYQTRVIRCFPNGQGFVMGSIEGRVAVRMFDKSAESQKKSYVFKCHREKEENREVIYPVMAVSFHQRYNTFATGGSDGVVNTWDGFNRKWLTQFKRYPTTVSSLDFNEEGTQLAVASSYFFENGDPASGDCAPPPPPAIFIQTVNDAEVRRKNLPPPTNAANTVSAASTVPPTRY